MNIVFVHDYKIKKNEKQYYFEGGLFNKDNILKYTNVDNKNNIIIYTRQENLMYKNIQKFDLLPSDIKTNPSEVYNSPIDMFKKSKEIKKEIKNILKNIDICIIRLPSVLGFLVFYEAKKENIPIFIEMVACPWDSLWNYGNIKGNLFAPIMYFLTKNIIKKSKYVQYVSEEFLQERYPTKGLSIGCSDVVITDINEEILNKRIEKINKKVDNKYIFGIVGSLNVAYKGHEVSIKALSLLKDKIDFELHFLGAGNKEKWIKLAKKYNIEKNIVFDGTLPSGEAVFNWLDNLDIHLMMSKTEGLPRILVEAMSRASISIGSNVGGIPELIDGNCIVEKNDYKGLANKIEEIIKNKEFQISIAKTNFNNSKRFEKDILDKKRNEFYEKFLKENFDD